MTTFEPSSVSDDGNLTENIASQAESADQQTTNEGVARATGILALGNILSRILGLAREIVLSNVFGASRSLEAFNNALVVSKSLYDLLLAGHVNSAIVPVLSEVEEIRGREELWRLVSALVSMVVVVVSGIVLLIEIFAPQIVMTISGDDPRTIALSAELLRVTAPALIFMSLFAVLSGTLYALRKFTFPALAGAVFNASIVIVILFLVPGLVIVPELSVSGVQWTVQRPESAIFMVALAWVLAAVAQMALQIIGLRRAKISFTFNWRHPAVRQISILYIPVLFSLLIDTLVIRFFSYNLAARGDIAHGNNYMNWATTLIQFPQGLVATAISIAILPTLSRQAALIVSDKAGNHTQAFKDTLGLGLRLATTLILPASVGLFVLATPIIALIFEHGAFTAVDTEITGTALRLYLIGLPFAAIDLLLVYAFYARQDTLTPALIGVMSLIIYMGVAIVLHPTMGLYSLMVADSIKHITHALVSAVLLHRRINGFGTQKFPITLGKTVVASFVMGVVSLGAYQLLLNIISDQNFIGEVLLVGISGGLGVLVFLVLAVLLHISELRWVINLIAQRLGLKRG